MALMLIETASAPTECSVKDGSQVAHGLLINVLHFMNHSYIFLLSMVLGQEEDDSLLPS